MFFRNSGCLACGRPLGYDPERAQLIALEPAGSDSDGTPLWHRAGPQHGRSYRRCLNLDGPAACNWLIDSAEAASGRRDASPWCRCCRLNRVVPDASVPEDAHAWQRVALAQRRLVSALIGLGLPVAAKTGSDDPEGLAFDLRRQQPGGPPVLTGHADGVITIDLDEADDARREQRRAALHEPYRTLLGHLRHESGHHYWQRLIEGQPPRLEAFRALFGDERIDYAEALQRHYHEGAPPDWSTRHVSAYASAHPWEDWAETWAHYLHLRDTLDTARSFGLDGEQVELSYQRFTVAELADPSDPDPAAFLSLVNGWMELTGVLNELSRSIGVADFYPFILSAPALRKLHFVHRQVAAAAERGAPS